MASTYGHKPFGIRDIKITDITGSTQADLPSGRTLSFTERIRSGELTGDDSLTAVVAQADGIEFTLEAGGIDLDAYALMTGRSVTTTGTSPSRTSTLTGDGGDVFPYVKIYGQSINDDATSDIHVKIYKGKITSLEGRFQEGEFFVTSCNGIGIDDGSNGVYDFVQNETSTALPTD